MTREDVIAGMRRTPVEFTFPLGGRQVTVHLKPWGAQARQQWQTEHKNANGVDLYERLFLASVCDAGGSLLFSAHDIEAAREFDGEALEKIAVRVLELNGLRGDDSGKASSPTGPNSNSSAGSDSPSGGPSAKSSNSPVPNSRSGDSTPAPGDSPATASKS